MSGDYSRRRFKPEKHYQGVLRQQGRVDLDADWNEYVDIEDRRWRAGTIDVVGRYGVPSETPDGFKIGVSGGELTVGQGRIYVDGYLAENHGATPLFNATIEEDYGTAALSVKDQPYGGPVTVPTETRSLVYLDVWRREVTHLEAPDLVESAVNVDTTTRYQTAWQVRVLGNISEDATCQTPLDHIEEWKQANQPSGARLTTSTVAVALESDPCIIPPTGGYRGLENHLYRVEVHSVNGTTVGVKWSRENAHVVARVVEIKNGGTSLKVDSLGRDETLSFKNAGWVEIFRDSDEFGGMAGIMRQVEVDPASQTLTIAALDQGLFPDGPVNEDEHLRVIRWEQSGSDVTSEGVIELRADQTSFVLESGIQATLEGLAEARVGDYWCFAARTAEADIERLEQAPPQGIHHHYCKLAIIETDGTIHDCRPKFPALTELTSLFYVSGDGQEGLSGQVLPKPIEVGVSNGSYPLAGALVTLTVKTGGGKLLQGSTEVSSVTLPTDEHGLISCEWRLGSAELSQQVEAMLADGSHLPVRFNAMVSQPGGAELGIHVQKILVVGDPLQNDSEVTVARLINGIEIICDDALFTGSVLNKPVCSVTLELPFPLNTPDIQLWGDPVIGYQPLILGATVNSELESIFWLVTEPCKEWLGKLFDILGKQKRETRRVLARLTLKGNFIWNEKGQYLDGEVFGIPGSGRAITAVELPSGDGRRGGDLHLWFWLVESKPTPIQIEIEPKVAVIRANEPVIFTVSVTGTANSDVTMTLNPPFGGTIKPLPEAGSWIYQPSVIAPPVTRTIVTARSVVDSTAFNNAEILFNTKVEEGVTIELQSGSVLPGGELDMTIEVPGGDVTKIEMRVNDIINGNRAVGTLRPKLPGVWTYGAPAKEQTVKIKATSLQDRSKVATATLRVETSTKKEPRRPRR